MIIMDTNQMKSEVFINKSFFYNEKKSLVFFSIRVSEWFFYFLIVNLADLIKHNLSKLNIIYLSMWRSKIEFS